MSRLPAAAAPVSFGTTWPLYGAMFAAHLIVVAFAPQLLMAWIPLKEGPWEEERVNLVLVGVLGVACVLWLVARARAWVSDSTGTGLLLAGFGLAARIHAEALMWAVGWPVPQGIESASGVVAAATLVRLGGLAAIAFGLTCVAGAVVTERHFRRTAPAWVLPSD